MSDKTRRTLLGFGLSISVSVSVCLMAANCGSDPIIGTWTNSTAPTASASQYTSYVSTLTFDELKALTVDLEATRTGGAQTYAGCAESTLGTGTYTDLGTTLTPTLTMGTNARSGCVFAGDNLAAMPLNAMTKAVLLALASGTFSIVVDTMTLTSGNTMLKYSRK